MPDHAPGRVVFAIPGDLTTPTGGYAYDRRLLVELPRLGFAVAHLALPGSFPAPNDDDLNATIAALGAVSPDDVLLVDGLALGAIPPARLDGVAAPIVALVHHPLGLETGLTPARSAALIANETAVLARVRHVVVTSPATAATLLADLGVPEDRIIVAEPGTDPALRAPGGGDPPRLLAVGAISARKGYADLVAALATLADRRWHLTIAGDPSRARNCASALVRQVESAGLSHRITLAGAVDDATLAALYRDADLFVMASHYEGYGMVLTEALSRGLPIVTTSGGALADTFRPGTGLIVPPADPPPLATAIGRMLAEPDLRRDAADAAWRAASTLPRWHDTAALVARALNPLTHAFNP